MSEVKLSFIPKFEQSERIQILEARNQELALSGKRQMVYYGDHRCWINIGPFPHMDKVPSRIEGARMESEQWAADYACMLNYTEPHIYPCETIVGEIYWEVDCIRTFHFEHTENGEAIMGMYEACAELGAYPYAYGHTCPDVEIVLKEGYDGILERIRQSKEKYRKFGNEKKVSYLRGLEKICLACMDYIERYAKLAETLEKETDDPEEKARFRKIALCCTNVAHKAPADYYEAVQSLQFAILFDRSVGHGNGYGRMDQYLMPFYRKGVDEGTLTRTEAREYVAEMYMKLRGQFFSFGGRLADGSDATNEMSWVGLEAYDLVGDYNNLGVMWHSDIDPAYYDYVCDVLARHGESTPVLINWDNMYAAQIRSGIPHEDAWKVVYSGCQWFSIPGKEWCGHDSSHINVLMAFERALQRCLEEEAPDFDTLFRMYEEEVHRTMKIFQETEAVLDRIRGECRPEMYTSMISHGPIERGMDMTAPRGVDYQYTSLNIGGVPNVADCFVAIKKLVFEKGQYTLEEVARACRDDWSDRETMRLKFWNQPKYGNGLAEPDEMYVKVCNSILEISESYYNQRGGQPMRPSLYAFMIHLEHKDFLGATPDGRHKGDQFAQGINPQTGASKRGLIPMANSASSADMRKFQGGSIQVDIQPRFFDGKEDRYAYIRDFSSAFFQGGGQQINLHIMDLKKLEDAMEYPEKPEYRNLMVRITGYCARFVTMSREYQENFVSRMNYSSME